MKKRFLFMPTMALPLITIIPIVNNYSAVMQKLEQSKINTIAQTDVNNYTVITPELTHYKVGEKLDLRDFKVIYNDPDKGAIDVTNECMLNTLKDQELTQEGEIKVAIKHNDFNSSFKIYVEKEPQEVPCTDNVQKMGDINVKFRLMSNQECIFTGYESGNGNLEIPDYVNRGGIKYFIKQIPTNWSNGENDITGLMFKCSHLKKICDSAFDDTNCLNYYFNNKNEILEFPEGLEDIGPFIFSRVVDDYKYYTIKGYSFPSTLKKIDDRGLYDAPFISDEGQLIFKSIPTFGYYAFSNGFYSSISAIFGKTKEIATEVIKAMDKAYYSQDEHRLSLTAQIPRVLDDNGKPIVLPIVEPTWGNIKVKCVLKGDECKLTGYVGGTGTMIIPDYEDYNGKKYYVKEIPSDWSDGENDIEGLKFAKDCTHLRKICDHAFDGTNCLDYYINHKDQLLEFPEGLEEIGDSAFYGTDYGQNKIKGYSFPSTLKKIGSKAFSKAPYIDGDDDNGELQFKSIPEITSDAFYICGIPEHDCKFISGSTQEIAEQMVKLIKDNMSDDFSTGSDYLIPQVIEEQNI